MKASIVDLKFKTSVNLKALNGNETVSISFHCKIKGIISPAKEKNTPNVKNHPFFAMSKNNKQSTRKELERLRKSRYDA